MDDVIERLRAADDRSSPPHVFDLDTGLRLARVRARRRRVIQGAVGVSTVAAAVAVAAGMVWPDDPSDSAAADNPKPEQLLEAFTWEQKPQDELPDAYVGEASTPGADELVESSSRLVAQGRHVDYWTALDEAGNICLVLYMPEHGTGAQECRPPAAFAVEGVTAELADAEGDGSREQNSEAWLIPDGYDVDAISADRWALMMPNLAVRVPDIEPTEVLSVLAEPQRPEDRMPTLPDGREITRSIVDSTSRLVYRAEDVQVWAGLRTQEETRGQPEICVVVYMSHDSWATANSCATTGLVWDSGLEFGLEAGGHEFHGWLLPDGFELRPDETQEWTVVAPNLAVREPE
ncbi:hypothetical protein [Phytoactinopolyspora halotolerans]|uniref:Uncharacterized protein n=1 Tax=Phytoactinopolyspora halotolerans TaxID=1981512 RepID=A0A6L9SC89_9ACTN|nr:hypothetical protein [Phytoactinopolyspora halotolerans]NEE01630.1 hypothetical protein [Phytoactinopolyspora halotolerans]